jgi:hypothetical protein
VQVEETTRVRFGLTLGCAVVVKINFHGIERQSEAYENKPHLLIYFLRGASTYKRNENSLLLDDRCLCVCQSPGPLLRVLAKLTKYHPPA